MDVPAIMQTAHIATMGDLIATCIPRVMKFWICVTSLVDLVMRLSVEKRSMSSREKRWVISLSGWMPQRTRCSTSSSMRHRDVTQLP